MTKRCYIILFACAACFSCQTPGSSGLPIQGTWQLITGTTITKHDTVITDYTKGQKMIKIINDSHFSFLRHDLSKGKDTAIYDGGGGIYTLKDDQYTELLEFCSYREWEGRSFIFTVSINNDTLIQSGVEKLPDLGVDRFITEKYVRVK
jgi:hypothetical protein